MQYCCDPPGPGGGKRFQQSEVCCGSRGARNLLLTIAHPLQQVCYKYGGKKGGVGSDDADVIVVLEIQLWYRWYQFSTVGRVGEESEIYAIGFNCYRNRFTAMGGPKRVEGHEAKLFDHEI